jgi:hypothetical protein
MGSGRVKLTSSLGLMGGFEEVNRPKPPKPKPKRRRKTLEPPAARAAPSSPVSKPRAQRKSYRRALPSSLEDE